MNTGLLELLAIIVIFKLVFVAPVVGVPAVVAPVVVAAGALFAGALFAVPLSPEPHPASIAVASAPKKRLVSFMDIYLR
jgi:hypothetical protein